jgi:hypothetical protein
MAARFGLNSDLVALTPPQTEEARVLNSYRCAVDLLAQFAEGQLWGIETWLGGSGSKKDARKAARCVEKGLLGEQGPDAISHMAQGFGRATAANWRRSSQKTEDESDATRLADSAQRSDALAHLAGMHWPVQDRYGVLEELAEAERNRLFELDNPGAMIDVRGASEQVQAACEAVALALGQDFERFGSLLIEPVMTLNLEMVQLLAVTWNRQLRHWTNLLTDNPGPYYS